MQPMQGNEINELYDMGKNLTKVKGWDETIQMCVQEKTEDSKKNYYKWATNAS